MVRVIVYSESSDGTTKPFELNGLSKRINLIHGNRFMKDTVIHLKPDLITAFDGVARTCRVSCVCPFVGQRGRSR